MRWFFDTCVKRLHACFARRYPTAFAALLALCCVLFSQTSHARSNFFNLVDEETGQPLMRRSNGYEEPFRFVGLQDDPLALFEGASSAKRIRLGDSKPPVLESMDFRSGLVGYRFRNKETGRWVRVEAWPYDVLEKDVNKEGPSLAGKYVNQLKNRMKSGEISARNEWAGYEFDECTPFSFGSPVVLIDPTTSKPRWAKYYATAKLGFIPEHKLCAPRGWLVLNSTTIEGFADPHSLLVLASDKLDDGKHQVMETTVRLVIDAATGDILHGATPGMKEIDAEEVVQFKEAFFAKHTCPGYGERERRQAVQDKHFINTPLGRCMSQRIEAYMAAVLEHFFGEALPALTKDPNGAVLPR